VAHDHPENKPAAKLLDPFLQLFHQN